MAYMNDDADFVEPSPTSGPGLDGYLDIPPASTDMCFNQGSTVTSSLSSIPEAPTQPSSYLSLIPPIPPPPVTPYSPEGGHFYSPAPPVFPGLEVRPRLGSNNTSGPSGMAHAPRSTTLPHPGSHLGTRDIYSSATPSFPRRQPDHHYIPRSPSFPARRPHISPTSSPAAFAALNKMDGTYGSKSQQNIPPLGPLTSHGHLSYMDATSTPIKVDIHGVIDKGFFMADNEWTCYRRNYFSCVCSYSLTPLIPSAGMQFVPTGSQQAHTVYGFAMCISAVVAENENHAIELVQHTPKRDKGPIAKPEKVRLAPKPPQANHHPMGLYGDGGMGSGSRYDQGFVGQNPQNSAPTEHTFERIQFKQATANNGKRRAAQQYYHLIVELWADVGNNGTPDHYIKIAQKKSAKMIVRGRSPGHYQSERRGSTSSGPGGSAGSGMGGSAFPSAFGSSEYSAGPSIIQGGYSSTYDTRSGGYGGTRHHHELTMEPMISPDQVKAITEPKGYQYYPATIYEGEHDHRPHQVELFSHHPRHDTSDSGTNSSISSGYDHGKVKPELENGLPSLFYSGPYFNDPNTRLDRFTSKSSSSGHYPTLIPPPSTSSMSMT
ncbi:hypothetical protein QBC38DRAFT_455921 [Podospora fimiseda]|uniref:NDT80 domain-containing protein n=1 Tax=Podospora fimiseda TaxID=252190 RepID=A0AAN7GXT3_9PEZI|nr:hypothetical protein QBC38DRAFT_455921 [Podospora fimiseda]